MATSKRWTTSPNGILKGWTGAYEATHESAKANGWIVGRTTMAEMTKGAPHSPANVGAPTRAHHFGRHKGPFSIGLDRSGKLHFTKPDIGGDHVIVLLGCDVQDSHFAELASDGVSYIVAEDKEKALAPLLATLKRELGIAMRSSHTATPGNWELVSSTCIACWPRRTSTTTASQSLLW